MNNILSHEGGLKNVNPLELPVCVHLVWLKTAAPNFLFYSVWPLVFDPQCVGEDVGKGLM